jgi:hypothetical protein
VNRRQHEERDREHERARFAGPLRDPGENHGFGRPADDENGPVQRQRQRNPGEPDADRDEQPGDLGAHALPEAEGAEEYVRDRECKHPGGHALKRATILDEATPERSGERCIEKKHGG